MIITHIELENWGPHKSLKADINSNVIGIIGGNGHGKSNLLQAIDYGLNGNLNKQNKELYIYNFGKEGGATKATVKICFTKNGQSGVITRTITSGTSKRKLVWEGKEYTSDAAVASQMEKILGADKAAMSSAIFIKQGYLPALVKSTPAQRQEILQKLMNLAFLDSRSNDLRNKIDRLKAGITDYRPTLDLLVKQLGEANAKLEEASNLPEDPSEKLTILRDILSRLEKIKQLTTMSANARGDFLTHSSNWKKLSSELGVASMKEVEDNVIKLRDTVSTLKTKRANLGLVENYTSMAASLKSKIDDTNKTIKETEERLARNKKLVSDDEYERCKNELEAIHSFLSVAPKYESAKKAVDDAQAQLMTAQKALLTWELAQNSKRISELGSQVRDLAKKHGILELKLTYLNSGISTDACPICGSAVRSLEGDDLSKAIEETKQELSDTLLAQKGIEAEIEQLNNTKQNLLDNVRLSTQKYNTSKSVFDYVAKQKSDLEGKIAGDTSQERIAELNQTLKLQSDIRSEIAVDTNALVSLGKAMTSFVNTYKDALRNLNNCKKKVGNLNAHTVDNLIMKAKDELAEAENVVKSVKPTYNAMEESMRLMEKYNEEAASAIESMEASEGYNRAWELFKNEIDIDDTDAVSAAISRYETGQLAYLNARASLYSIKAHIAQLVTQKEETEAKANVEKERLDLISRLETVLRITSKNGAPLAYMNSVFGKITERVKDLLGRMGANFTVFQDMTRPCTFRFIRTDDNSGYSMPQEMLSGGQAIRLSLALLIASQQLILPDVGLLVLDEPSSHMDEDGVNSLRELFLQMTTICHSSETQIIAVDHNSTLATAFEKTITL